MKEKLHHLVHKKMSEHDRLYGTTTMGARGQVVIPAEARKDLKIKPGDQLLVMGKFGKALAFIKTDQLQALINMVMQNLSGSGHEAEVKDYIENFFGKNVK